MGYIIFSGKYETGNEEQQQGYKQLLGEENILYKFDLYFHWYNLVHELGHCVVEKHGAQMPKVMEEMFVNEFAVGYYRYIGEDERLDELKEILLNAIGSMPSPVPEGESFTSFYEKIWNTDMINQVAVYGYFQMNSVLEAIQNNRSFPESVNEIGISIQSGVEIRKCNVEVLSVNAEIFLNTALENMKSFGIDVPEIHLELCENPLIQYARPDNMILDS